MIDSNKITELIKKKFNLIRKIDIYEINEDDGNKQISSIEDEIKQINNKFLEENKMEEVKNESVESVVEKSEVSQKRKSITDLIIKALGMKTIKNMDDTVKIIKKWQPEMEEKAIKIKVYDILYSIRKGQKRWESYNWNETEFLLTKKA
jgi:GTPase involved in cell partitioning and DNA repair